MFVIVQIPFVDFRILSSPQIKEYEDYFLPNTFERDLEKVLYYRFFGRERNRYNPSELPLSERRFFDSQKLVSLKYKGFIGKHKYYPHLVFSRFFEEEQCFHFDIGIREAYRFIDTPQDLNRFAKDFLSSPLFQIHQRYEKKDVSYDIIGLAKKVREIYLYATSSKKIAPKKNYLSQVKLGIPALFIVYDRNDTHYMGKAQCVNLENGIQVFHDLLLVKNILFEVWYIEKEGLQRHNQDLRNLRIYLSKLHSYKESTRIILEHLEKNGNKDIDIFKVTDFLESILNKIGRERYYGYDNNDFWNIAFHVDNVYNRVSWNEFKDSIEAKLRAFKMSTNNINNFSLNIDNSPMDNSAITIGSQNVNVFIKSPTVLNQSIQEFEDAVNNILNEIKELSEEEQAQIKDRAESFASYVKDEKTSKKTAEILLESLKGVFPSVLKNAVAIKALFEIGEKIVSLLK